LGLETPPVIDAAEDGVKRVLFLTTTTGYQTRMFGEAASRLGVELVFATDRCDQLEDPWADRAIPIRFHREAQAVEALTAAAAIAPFHGVLAVGDRPTVVAARVAQSLGLPGNRPEAAVAARDKRKTRESFRAAGLPGPRVLVVPASADPERLADELDYPLVVKPAALSGSRGVMRADNPAGFLVAFERLGRLLASDDVRLMRDSALQDIIIETFIHGREYAIEGVIDRGRLQTLAIFDKPDPLDGPLFEETIYVTPTRAEPATIAAIEQGVARAVAALGLWHGPIHAECRVNFNRVFMLEVAARPIGGLCARALRFVGPGDEAAGLEELLLRHALGEDVRRWRREPRAAGVMMIPIPAGGLYRRVHGVDEALRVEGVEEVRITAKPDQPLVPLPEGSSYLGFIFSRADDPDGAEHALRAAHACLTFDIDRRLPVL
jgi:biotin carboxylase